MCPISKIAKISAKSLPPFAGGKRGGECGKFFTKFAHSEPTILSFLYISVKKERKKTSKESQWKWRHLPFPTFPYLLFRPGGGGEGGGITKMSKLSKFKMFQGVSSDLHSMEVIWKSAAMTGSGGHSSHHPERSSRVRIPARPLICRIIE